MARRALPDVIQRITSTYEGAGIEKATAATKEYGVHTEVVSKKAEAAAKRAAAAHEAAARNITRSYLDMASAVDPKISGLASVGQKATSALGDMQRAGVGAGAQLGLGIAGAALTAAAALGEFTRKGIDEFTHLGDQVRALKNNMGGTAEEASRLIETGNALNVNSETLGAGFYKLSQRIAAGEKGFEEYGISVAHTKAGAVDITATLYNIADAFNATTDPVLKNRIAFEAFGKSGNEMIPILAKGRDTLKELSDHAQNVFTEKDLNDVYAYEQAQKRLEETNRKTAISFGRDMVPVVQRLSEAVQGGIKWLDDFDRALNLGGKYTHDNTSATISNTAAIDANSAATQPSVTAANERAIALDKQYSAQLGLIDAELRAKDAAFQLAAGQDAIARAEEALQKARQGGSQSGVRSATRSLEQARDALRKAQEAQNSPARTDQRAVAEERAQKQIEVAQDAAAKAASNLLKLQRLGAQGSEVYTQALEAQATTQDNVTVAQHALVAARQSQVEQDAAAADRVQQAAEAVKSAEESLQSAREAAAPQADRIRAAEDSLAQARRSQIDHLNSAAHAQENLAKIQAESRGETFKSKDALDAYKKALEELAGKTTGPAHYALLGMIADLNAVQAAAELARFAAYQAEVSSHASSERWDATHPYTPGPLAANYHSLKFARANGGPVVPGQMYTVGERGPERVTFDQPGMVWPHGVEPPGSVGGAGGITVNIAGDVRDQMTVREIGRELAWQARTNR